MYTLINVTFYTLGAILLNIIDIMLTGMNKTMELTVKNATLLHIKCYIRDFVSG